jgi:hypothetical protein
VVVVVAAVAVVMMMMFDTFELHPFSKSVLLWFLG